MIDNNATLEHIGGTLVRINTLFDEIDWESRFYQARLDLMKHVDMLEASNQVVQTEINQLRRGQNLTTDPARAHSLHMLAQEMQRAYDKQMQLTFDLHNVVLTMMDYEFPASDLGQPMPHANVKENFIPKDEKDLRALLRWDGMRDRMYDAQHLAANWAQQVSADYCASTSP